MSRDNELLFNRETLYDYLRRLETAAQTEVQGFQSDYLLQVSLDDLAAHLTDTYQLEPVSLDREGIHIGENGETKIDVSRDPRYTNWHGGKCFLPVTFATFIVPFTGNPGIFELKPLTSDYNPPRGRVVSRELHLRYNSGDQNAASMKAAFNRDLEHVEQYLSWGREQIKAYNQSITQTFRQQLEARKGKFLKDRQLVEGLGFPIRRRDGMAQTYAAPVTRKKLPIQRPTVPTGTFSPEPALENEHYENILAVISNMVVVMERSPQVFAKIGEEDLRTHFLVQLNSQYEGQASGETFNYEGKTDILIRAEGRNIFIGECKFWTGADTFTATINQLLGYTAWRDTKTAIILFNRNKNMSAVVGQIPGLVQQHPNFKRQLSDFKHETGFRFVLHQRDDKNREFTLTVLVFDVPT